MDQIPQIAYFTRQMTSSPIHTFVLIHGNRSSQKYWDKLQDQLFLQNNQIRTISLDLRGFGKSNHITNVQSLNDFAADIHKVILGFCKNEGLIPQDIREKFTLTGWSLGGIITMLMSALYPEYYQRIILIAPGPISGYPIMMVDEQGNPTNNPCKTREEVENNPAIKIGIDSIHTKDPTFFKNIANRWYNEGPKPTEQEHLQLIQECLLQTNYRDVVWILHQYDLRNLKDQIQGPILLVHGKQDLVVPFNKAQEIESVLGKEKVNLVEIDPAGHMLPIVIPEQIAKLMFQFIQQKVK